MPTMLPHKICTTQVDISPVHICQLNILKDAKIPADFTKSHTVYQFHPGVHWSTMDNNEDQKQMRPLAVPNQINAITPFLNLYPWSNFCSLLKKPLLY